MAGKIIEGETIPKSIRGITPETFKKWRYQTGTFKGEPVHIANHYSQGRVVGQKIRTRSKDFQVKGRLEPLYGMWLWSPTKRVVVTEGELDALSVSQAQGNKWPVVSLSNGAQSAAKAFAEASEWLVQFEEVVIMFDQDEVGQDAAVECAKVLPPGKAKIAYLDEKDANDLLKAGKADDIVKAIWNAKEYRPDGIVPLSDVIHDALKPPEYGIAAPWQTMTDLMFGFRPGEWYCFGAGVGVGKSDVFMEIMGHLVDDLQLPVAGIFLEQPMAESAKRLAGKVDGTLYHIPDQEIDEAQLEKTLRDLGDRVYLYNHFGSTDWDVIRDLIRYLRYGCNVRHIFLDHLTALAAHAEDERRYLDSLCAELSSLCQELQITMYVVSHLTTPKGESHEEGGRVKESQFTGSRAIARWAHYMIGLERDKQHEDEAERHITTVRFLKDRYTGRATGKTFRLRYEPETGALLEAPPKAAEDTFNDEEDGF